MVFHKEKLLPIVWSEWDLMETMSIQFYNVIFTEDFGEYKQGQQFDTIFVDFGEGFIKGYKNDTVYPTQFFKCVPGNHYE